MRFAKKVNKCNFWTLFALEVNRYSGFLYRKAILLEQKRRGYTIQIFHESFYIFLFKKNLQISWIQRINEIIAFTTVFCFDYLYKGEDWSTISSATTP